MTDSLNGIFSPQGDKVINPSINGHDPEIHVELLKPADVAPAILPDDVEEVLTAKVNKGKAKKSEVV
jgi:hypothetical protein